MNHQHRVLAESFGASSADIVEVQVIQHGRAGIAAQLGGLEEGQDHDRHEQLLDLNQETLKIGHLVGGVIDGREPAQVHAKDDDGHQSGEKGGHRKADHGHNRSGLIKDRILLIGRDDAYRYGDKDGEEIGQSHNPQRLWQAFDDQIDDGAAGGPGSYAQPALRVSDLDVKDLFDGVERLVDEKLP